MHAEKDCNPDDQNYIESILDTFSACSTPLNTPSNKIFLFVDLESGKAKITYYRNQSSSMEKIRQFIQQFIHRYHLNEKQLLRLHRCMVHLDRANTCWFKQLFNRLTGGIPLSKKVDDLFRDVLPGAEVGEEYYQWLQKNCPQLELAQLRSKNLGVKKIEELCHFFQKLEQEPTTDQILLMCNLLARNIPMERGWDIVILYETYPKLPKNLSTIRLLASMSDQAIADLLESRKEFGIRWKTENISPLLHLIQERSTLPKNEQTYRIYTAEIKILLKGFCEDCSREECRRIATVVYYYPSFINIVPRIRLMPTVMQYKLIDLGSRLVGRKTLPPDREKIQELFENFLSGDSLEAAMDKAGLVEPPFLVPSP